AEAAASGGDVEALHLAGAGVERAEGDAAECGAVRRTREEERAGGRRVAAGEGGQLGVEALVAEVDGQGGGVGAEEPRHGCEVVGRGCRGDGVGGGGHGAGGRTAPARAASISARIRRIASSRPVKIASPIRKWPMFSSRSSGRAAMGPT